MRKLKAWLQKQPPLLLPIRLYLVGLAVLALMAMQMGDVGGLIILYAIAGRFLLHFHKAGSSK